MSTRKKYILIILLVLILPALLAFTVFGPPGNVSVAPILTNGAILWPNNVVMLTAKDSGGTPQTVLFSDSSNAIYLSSMSSTGQVTLQTGGGARFSCTNGTCSFNVTPSSTVACAGGFTRIGVNFCRKDSVQFTTWSDAAACTAHTFGSNVPATAKQIMVGVDWIALSNNAVATRTNQITFFSDASCTNSTNRSLFRTQEFVATAAGTTIGEATDHVLVPAVGADTVYATQANAGGNGNADANQVWIEGYNE